MAQENENIEVKEEQDGSAVVDLPSDIPNPQAEAQDDGAQDEPQEPVQAA